MIFKFLLSSLLSDYEIDDDQIPGRKIRIQIDNRNKYDFPDFQNYLLNNITEVVKRTALIFTLKPLAKEGIQLMCKELRKRIWIMAALSGAGG